MHHLMIKIILSKNIDILIEVINSYRSYAKLNYLEQNLPFFLLYDDKIKARRVLRECYINLKRRKR